VKRGGYFRIDSERCYYNCGSGLAAEGQGFFAPEGGGNGRHGGAVQEAHREGQDSAAVIEHTPQQHARSGGSHQSAQGEGQAHREARTRNGTPQSP